MTPIDLVSGFLGAGKTTFIKRYAAWLRSRGRRVVVVENEFGLLNIDSAMLRDDGTEVAELSGGCICCGLKRSFRDLLLVLARSDVHIVVEPSGIFNPRDFFDVAADPDVAAGMTVGSVLTVVDPAVIPHLDDTSRIVMREQLNSAGQVLVSRTGGLDEEARRDAAEAVAAFLDGPVDGRIDTRPWDSLTDDDFAALSVAGYRRTENDGRYWNHATLYDSLVVKAAAEFDAAELAEAVAMTYRDVGVVIRLKGYVPRRGGGFYELNCTRFDRGIRKTDRNHRAFVVAVGRTMNRTRLETLFSRT
ncbi:MAG: hypothetical protein LIQ31_06695 [Planctomycetes bacterium]|nr:hypothetical protein [Planctomycetota bacterium]